MENEFVFEIYCLKAIFLNIIIAILVNLILITNILVFL